MFYFCSQYLPRNFVVRFPVNYAQTETIPGDYKMPRETFTGKTRTFENKRKKKKVNVKHFHFKASWLRSVQNVREFTCRIEPCGLKVQRQIIMPRHRSGLMSWNSKSFKIKPSSHHPLLSASPYIFYLDDGFNYKLLFCTREYIVRHASHNFRTVSNGWWNRLQL